MPGGAQLIGDILQGAFGSDLANQSPAAGGYMVTPDQQLDEFNRVHKANYKSIDEAQQADDPDVQKAASTLSSKPLYYDKTGQLLPEGTVKSPDDLLPFKKPNFFQRAFGGQNASIANQENAQFEAQPSLVEQQHRVQQGIAGRDFSTVQPAIGQSVKSWSPAQGAVLTGDNPTMGNIAGANVQSLGIGAGVPESQIQTELARNTAEQAGDVNEATRQGIRTILGVPQTQARTEQKGLTAENLLAGNTIQNAGAQGQLTGMQLKNAIDSAPIEQQYKIATLLKQKGMADEDLALLGLDQDTLKKTAEYGNWKAGHPPIAPYRTSLVAPLNESGSRYKMYPDYLTPGGRLTQKDLYGNYIQDMSSQTGTPSLNQNNKLPHIMLKDGSVIPLPNLNVPEQGVQ